MIKKDCLNCRTHFCEGEKLPLEGISVELKNFALPIKEQKHKWILLKTICGFLNSKGGTIYIGAQDSTGEIKGVIIQRKQQDDFRLFVHQLVTRLQPKVDLFDKEQVKTQFVPILKNDKFTNKYLVKIAVEQGNPKRLYCFSQKINFQAAGDKKNDEYQVVYSYRRLTTGNMQQYKGLQVVNQAQKKSQNPSKYCQTFHEDCNPEPVALDVQVLKIGFGNIIDKNTRTMLEDWFKSYLKQLNIEQPLLEYDKSNKMVVIEFETKKQHTNVQTFIDKHLQKLNQCLEDCYFLKGQIFLDCLLYKNSIQHQVQQKEEKIKIKKEIKKQIKKEIKKQIKSSSKPKETKTENKQKNKQQNKRDQDASKSFKKKYCLTFTHINPKTKKQFMHYLEHDIMQCQLKIASQYENTVQIFFETQEDMANYYFICLQTEQISQFGFKNKLIFGSNTGCLEIHHYDKHKWKKLSSYLQQKVGKDLRQIYSQKRGNSYCLIVTLNSKRCSCLWLDKLLHDKQIKNFQITGAQKGSKKGSQAKMKIYLGIDTIDIEEF